MKNKPIMWLKELRKAAGLSQYQIADKLGMSQSGYSGYEDGKRRIFPDTAKKIAAVLNFEWTRFYEGGAQE